MSVRFVCKVNLHTQSDMEVKIGCGCGKKFSSVSRSTTARVSSSSPVPPQVQQAMYAKRVVQSQTVPTKTVQRRTV